MEHQVGAVGSRDLAKAEAFIRDTGATRSNAKGYGTYEGVYNDQVWLRGCLFMVGRFLQATRMLTLSMLASGMQSSLG